MLLDSSPACFRVEGSQSLQAGASQDGTIALGQAGNACPVWMTTECTHSKGGTPSLPNANGVCLSMIVSQAMVLGHGLQLGISAVAYQSAPSYLMAQWAKSLPHNLRTGIRSPEPIKTGFCSPGIPLWQELKMMSLKQACQPNMLEHHAASGCEYAPNVKRLIKEDT